MRNILSGMESSLLSTIRVHYNVSSHVAEEYNKIFYINAFHLDSGVMYNTAVKKPNNIIYTQ